VAAVVALLAAIAVTALVAVAALPLMLMSYVPDRFPDGINPVIAMFGLDAVPVLPMGAVVVSVANIEAGISTMFNSGSWLVVVLSLLSNVTEMEEPLEGLKAIPLLGCAPGIPFRESSQSFTTEVTSTMTYLLAVVTH